MGGDQKIQLQEIVNILPNMLDSGVGEAYVKFEDKNIEKVSGVPNVVFIGIE